MQENTWSLAFTWLCVTGIKDSVEIRHHHAAISGWWNCTPRLHSKAVVRNRKTSGSLNESQCPAFNPRGQFYCLISDTRDVMILGFGYLVLFQHQSVRSCSQIGCCCQLYLDCLDYYNLSLCQLCFYSSLVCIYVCFFCMSYLILLWSTI